MTWAAAYGPTPGSASSRRSTSSSGSSAGRRLVQRLEIDARRRRRTRRGRGGAVRGSRPAPPRGRSPRGAAAMAAGVGKARPPCRPRARPAPARPASRTRAPTMRSVADQAQLVVHTVLTTSSNTVGLRSMRPAPAHAQASAGSPRGLRVEGAEVVVQAQHAPHRGGQRRRGRRRPAVGRRRPSRARRRPGGLGAVRRLVRVRRLGRRHADGARAAGRGQRHGEREAALVDGRPAAARRPRATAGCGAGPPARRPGRAAASSAKVLIRRR